MGMDHLDLGKGEVALVESEIHVYCGVGGVAGIRVTMDGLRLLEYELSCYGSTGGIDRYRRGLQLNDLAYAMLSYEFGELAADAFVRYLIR